MAQITINIPVNSEDWVLNGFAIRFNYQTQVANPDYDNQIAEDPDTNPQTIDNPETLPEFAKRMIIWMIKDAANQGHNTTVLEDNAIIANTIELT